MKLNLSDLKSGELYLSWLIVCRALRDTLWNSGVFFGGSDFLLFYSVVNYHQLIIYHKYLNNVNKCILIKQTVKIDSIHLNECNGKLI